jgi:class 3 adenylate cyclase/tetratricopeptide (TPR) repeat protein
MSEREKLQRAIAALEAQRATLGDAVVDAALAPMRDKLAAFGQSEQAPDQPAARERRVVTILFCDVTGSTAMAEQLDPEVWTGIMNDAFAALSEPIERFGGTLARLMGDAILAFFGAPTAHEDDPRRAVSAALAIVDGIQPLRRELRRQRDLDFNVRVGINTGLVVVGDVGSKVREEYTAMGDAVNLAARMEQTAQPGTVLIAEGTYKLVTPYFDVRAIGEVKVKGKSAPVAAYQVLAEAKQVGPARGLATHGIHSPLVGREAEFATASDALARLQRGKGGILFVFGEAGVGKSRLRAELFQAFHAAATPVPTSSGPDRAAAPPQLQWLEGHAQSFGQSISFRPLQEILRAFANITQEDDDRQAWRKLESAVQALFPARTTTVLPYLALALNLEVSQPYLEKVKYLDGKALGEQITLAFHDLFQALAAKRPLVLVFEDLHWIDDSSARLLERLLSLVKSSPLLICGLSRPLPESPAFRLAERARQDVAPLYTELQLAPLAAADSNRLVQNLLEIADLPLAVRERIVRKASGNPFFLEEIIRNLIEAGLVVHDPSTGRWRATSRVASIPIPDTIQGVIMARLDRLDESAKEVLRAAAVIGRNFLFRLLDHVLEEEVHLPRHLDQLASVELIREKARRPELEYIFKHALARDATYQSILLAKRRQLHARVGRAIERLFIRQLEELYGLLAYHFTAAGDWDKAQHYLFQVGDQAQGMAADAEALAHYRQAITAYEHAFGKPMAPLQRGSVERKMGDAYFRLGRLEQSWTYSASAVARLDRALPATPVQEAIALGRQMVRQLLHRFWPKRFPGNRSEQQKLAAQEALLAHMRLGQLAYFEGRSPLVMLYIGLRTLNLAEMTGYPQDMVRGYAIAAIGAGGAGSLRLADYYMSLAREADQKHDDPSAHALFLNFWGGNRLGGCRWHQAAEALEAAAAVNHRIGNGFERENALHNLAFVLQRTGRSRHVSEIRNEAMASAERRGERQMIIWSLFYMTEDRLRSGAPGLEKEISNLLDRAQTLLADNPNQHDEIMAHSLRAQSYHRQGDLDAARLAVETALHLARHLKHPLYPYLADAPAALPFVALSLWEAAPGGDARELATAALSFFRSQARSITAYLLPRASLYQGTYYWLSRKQRQAKKAWSKSLALAQRFEMPYDQALVHYEIGRHLPPGAPDRIHHLQRAVDIYTQLDAAWNLALATAALGQD